MRLSDASVQTMEQNFPSSKTKDLDILHSITKALSRFSTRKKPY